MWKRTIIFYCFVALRCLSLFHQSLSPSVSFFISANLLIFAFCVCECVRVRGPYTVHSRSAVTFAPPRLVSTVKNKWNNSTMEFSLLQAWSWARSSAISPPSTYPWKWFIKNSFIKRNSYHFRWIAKRRWGTGAVVYNLQAKKFTSKMHIIDIFYVCRTCVCVCLCFEFCTCRFVCTIWTGQTAPFYAYSFVCDMRMNECHFIKIKTQIS